MVRRVWLSAAIPLLMALAGGAHARDGQPAGTTPAPAAQTSVRRAEPVFKAMYNYVQYGKPGPYYPVRAERMKLEGEAVLQCVLKAKGVLDDCRVVSETPEQAGFGIASLKMAQQRWVTAKPRLADGQPLEEETVEVVVPFAFLRH